MYDVVTYTEEDNAFYPTPPDLAKRMISDLDFDKIHSILEPSAGKGDILRELAKKEKERYYHRSFDVDCIEIDPHLRQILKYNFSDAYKSNFPNADDPERDRFFSKGIHIVHDDFLTYKAFKRYDLIIMNPPFANGDVHLLKAIEMQKKGGSIVCLLNAETLRNTFSETRKELKKQLEKYGASVEFISGAFKNSERKTDVEVALIKLYIAEEQEESDIFNHFKKAEEMDDFDIGQSTDLTVADFIKATITLFRVEASAGLELIRQYKAMIPYMRKSFGEDSWDKEPILRLTDSNDRGYDSVSPNEFLKKVRLKYWRELLQNPKFVNKLTSKLQSEYMEKVDRLSDYDFTEYNIYTLANEMNSNVKKGIEDAIVSMFDTLTAEHSWYPETQKNRHYYDGWATNKAHKIGKKVIIPCYGVFNSWDGKPREYEARKALEDIERILNFLDGGMSQDVDFWHYLEVSFKQGITKNIQLKYFKATFYKKGTVHLEFTCPELIERFNIYAAQNKAWLPPNYGKARYEDLSVEEKNVIDSFQGKEAYENVMRKASFYLAPVTNNKMLLLEK